MTEMSAKPGAGLAKAYQPGEVEGEIYRRWLEADVFAPDGVGSRPDPGRPPFVIIMPPPNVTGALHLGHALVVAVEDLMIRHHRMLGHPTLWLPGVDHASIAAQAVLDRIIAKDGESRASLGRERYLDRMWRFMNETREVILSQSRRLGASADWSRTRFTMDEISARAVREAFTRLYREGLAYRTEALINWCPTDRTSLSDLEVIATPEVGTIWTIRYHLLDTDGHPDTDAWISVATTRPETILGDVAVAVHPDDERYRGLVGRTALIPFVNRPVPIIADPVVEREFGTGAVKITPAHDHTDFETGRRHGLPMINVMDDESRINANGGPFAGLDRTEARREILAHLEASNDLEAARPHDMVIGRCQRSNDIVEPRLKTQWFIRTKPLAEQALDATRSRRARILPERFEKEWEHWLTEIRDWNVSRQLWWGHRIPAWYCPDGHITVTADPNGPRACEACGEPAERLTQDPDIFDTWFSSGLWPFSTLGWPEQTDDLRRYYPGTVMETGYDIIFFWVARMMMLGIHLMGDVPFRIVYLHGLVRDPYGQKMSKTKGNVVDPLEAIDEIGADALRFALIHGTSPGNDQKFSSEKLENARNFGNKLWNAARFVLGARPATIPADARRPELTDALLGPVERWIRSRAAATTADVNAAMESDAFGEVTRILYEAIWSEYCDWGLEFAKVRLADESLPPTVREATWWTLVDGLDTYLRLLHPVMPFITEAIWGTLPRRLGDPEFLIVADWPDRDQADHAAEAAVGEIIELVRGIRNARAEARLEPSAWLPVDVAVVPERAATFDELRPAIERLSRARPLTRHTSGQALHAAVGDGGLSVIVSESEAVVARGATGEGTDDLERARLEKELAQAASLLAAARARLANEDFVRKAPPSVVEGARAREAELADQAARLAERLGR